MADVPTRSRRLLWHERLHEVDRHEAAWPKDLRDEPAHGAKFDSKSRNIVFSRHAPPADVPLGVEFGLKASKMSTVRSCYDYRTNRSTSAGGRGSSRRPDMIRPLEEGAAASTHFPFTYTTSTILVKD